MEEYSPYSRSRLLPFSKGAWTWVKSLRVLPLIPLHAHSSSINSPLLIVWYSNDSCLPASHLGDEHLQDHVSDGFTSHHRLQIVVWAGHSFRLAGLHRRRFSMAPQRYALRKRITNIRDFALPFRDFWHSLPAWSGSVLVGRVGIPSASRALRASFRPSCDPSNWYGLSRTWCSPSWSVHYRKKRHICGDTRLLQ